MKKITAIFVALCQFFGASAQENPAFNARLQGITAVVGWSPVTEDFKFSGGLRRTKSMAVMPLDFIFLFKQNFFQNTEFGVGAGVIYMVGRGFEPAFMIQPANISLHFPTKRGKVGFVLKSGAINSSHSILQSYFGFDIHFSPRYHGDLVLKLGYLELHRKREGALAPGVARKITMVQYFNYGFGFSIQIYNRGKNKRPGKNFGSFLFIRNCAIMSL